MKKANFILGMILGIVFGVGLAVGIYFLTVGEVAWKQYLEEKLVPSATAAVSSLLLIWLGILPVLKKVINATSLFNKATDNINTTVENGERASSSLEAFKADLSQKFTEAVEVGVSKMKEQDERIKCIERHSSNTEEIVRIGFGNTEELVNKGYAAEIAKVGADNEEDET